MKASPECLLMNISRIQKYHQIRASGLLKNLITVHGDQIRHCNMHCYELGAVVYTSTCHFSCKAAVRLLSSQRWVSATAIREIKATHPWCGFRPGLAVPKNSNLERAGITGSLILFLPSCGSLD